MTRRGRYFQVLPTVRLFKAAEPMPSSNARSLVFVIPNSAVSTQEQLA